MADRCLIYGATGYTGRLLAVEAVRRGLEPILAGRDPARLQPLARALGLEHRVAAAGEPRQLTGALRGVAVALNAAGPFAATARPLAAACLATRTHYVDVTGEIPVFAALRRRDGVARSRGVMLLPGAGFIVVPSDCLAAHVARRLPGATRLRLGISREPVASRGSARTMLGLIDWGVYVRRRGRLVLRPWSCLAREIDYGRGPRTSLAVNWPDVLTAYHTTGIPNVEVYLELDSRGRALFLASRVFAGLLRASPAQAFLQELAGRLPAGPSARQRALRRRVLVAEAEDSAGRCVRSRLRTPEGYTLTARAAVAVVARVLAGEVRAGFQTPAGLFGADFVLGLEGVVREDVAASSGLRTVDRQPSSSSSWRASTRSRVESPSV